MNCLVTRVGVKNMDILASINRTFESEITALLATQKILDASYVAAVNLIYKCEGKLIVTGLGKSGFIAQKIAATMVSTGTQAIYLHAGEAIHGDVGIIQQNDVVLGISKSGETDELITIINHAKHLSVPNIVITCSHKSKLAKTADISLITPVESEACPLGLAPTSSTTAALLVGDAISIALMELRNFSPDDFASNHPGGTIGKRLLISVADVMRSGENNPTIKITDDIERMLLEISSKRCGAVAVVDDDEILVGLITDYDIRNIIGQQSNIFDLKIKDIMNPMPTYTVPNRKASDALVDMRDRKNPFLVLPVIDEITHVSIGMLHLHDLVALGL